MSYITHIRDYLVNRSFHHSLQDGKILWIVDNDGATKWGRNSGIHPPGNYRANSIPTLTVESKDSEEFLGEIFKFSSILDEKRPEERHTVIVNCVKRLIPENRDYRNPVKRELWICSVRGHVRNHINEIEVPITKNSFVAVNMDMIRNQSDIKDVIAMTRTLKE